MNRVTCLLAVMALVSAASSVKAQEEGNVHVKYRERVMKSIGANMGAIGDIIKNQLPHQANIAAHGEAIRLSSTLITSAFRVKVTANTDALPVIWEKWEDFVAAAADLEVASKALAEIAASDDMTTIGPAVRAVGQSCGSCHRAFRRQDD
ncbi:MAG: cytochrome c [Candidatus Latescibacterota bacterium]|nr:cytochrome c [Candidatus Latescibacterota bacterium]